MNYPFAKQLDGKDCGPACIRMVAQYYGKNIDSASARSLCNHYRNGTTLFTISQAAKSIGFSTLGVKITKEQLLSLRNNTPFIALWNKNHFIVVWKITENKVIVGDPAIGTVEYSHKNFLESWIFDKTSSRGSCGILLFLEKTADFSDTPIKQKGKEFSTIDFLQFLKPNKKLIFQFIFSLLIGALISLVFPFLSQAIVDIGIETNNTNFILCVLIGQLGLALGMSINRFIGNWLLLHISSRVSITMIRHFLEKLMNMKLSFFDSKMIGDLLFRIQDFNRVESFLTTSLMSIIIAFIGVCVYSFVLLEYGYLLLIVFLLGSLLYLIWIYVFKKYRKKIDYMRYQQLSTNQSQIIHYIKGIQEIKLNNCEGAKLEKWENIQLKIYGINILGLKLSQIQATGAYLIDQLKNIFITFIAANWVINGSITIGMMIAITYIIGQLNGPIYEFSNFIQSLHEAQISIERINEINTLDDEEIENNAKGHDIQYFGPIVFKDVYFRYPGPNVNYVLKACNITLLPGSVTAIVGESGSGKSTLLKLLMGFYEPTKGSIQVGDTPFDKINIVEWRRKCAAVLQEGYLFTETIAQNIAISEKTIDMDRVVKAAMATNMHDFIMSLPLGYETIIGEDGLALSSGQKQRLYIARAIYKDSPFLFFDEATNALDAHNERAIIEKMSNFFKSKTVVIVAHRLSTIINADNIIVLKNGIVKEQGTHQELLRNNNYYTDLIAKQLYIKD